MFVEAIVPLAPDVVTLTTDTLPTTPDAFAAALVKKSLAVNVPNDPFTDTDVVLAAVTTPLAPVLLPVTILPTLNVPLDPASANVNVTSLSSSTFSPFSNICVETANE